MPHTYAWNITDPPGSEQAKNIDNQIRKLRVQIQDLFNDIVTDVTDDPIVINPTSIAPRTGLKRLISFAAFNSDTDGKETEYRAGYLYAFTDTSGLFADVDIPVGCKIVKVEVLVDKADATSIEFDLYSRPFATGAGRPTSLALQSSLIHVSGSSGGTSILDSGAVDITIVDTLVYYLVVEAIGAAGNSFDLFGARITYDEQ